MFLEIHLHGDISHNGMIDRVRICIFERNGGWLAIHTGYVLEIAFENRMVLRGMGCLKGGL